eukprot:1003654-Alexandrium_andersonii.AAC.1
MGGLIVAGGEPHPEISARVHASQSSVAQIRKPALAAQRIPAPPRISLLDSLATTRLLYNAH